MKKSNYKYIFIEISAFLIAFNLINIIFLGYIGGVFNNLTNFKNLIIIFVDLIGIIGIITSVETYRSSKKKDKFDYTMTIIKNIEKDIGQSSSKNYFDKEFLKSKKNLGEEWANDAYNLSIRDIKGFGKNWSLSHKLNYQEIMKKDINELIKYTENQELDKKALFRVISEIMVKLNRDSIYIVKKEVKVNFTRNEVQASLKLFFIKYWDSFNEMINNNDKYNAVNLYWLEKLKKLWKL